MRSPFGRAMSRACVSVVVGPAWRPPNLEEMPMRSGGGRLAVDDQHVEM